MARRTKRRENNWRTRHFRGARRRWDETEGNPRLLFSHEPNAHVLAPKFTLG